MLICASILEYVFKFVFHPWYSNSDGSVKRLTDFFHINRYYNSHLYPKYTLKDLHES